MNIQIGGEAKRNLLVALGALCGLLISVMLLFLILTESKHKKEVKEGNKLILPAGSVVRVKTINGIVIPLFGQKESRPVLFRVLSAAFGDKKIGLEGEFCSIVGEARITDYSTERIDIRTIRIKCSGNDRITKDIPMDGYLVDADGVVGIKGKVESLSDFADPERVKLLKKIMVMEMEANREMDVFITQSVVIDAAAVVNQ